MALRVVVAAVGCNLLLLLLPLVLLAAVAGVVVVGYLHQLLLWEVEVAAECLQVIVIGMMMVAAVVVVVAEWACSCAYVCLFTCFVLLKFSLLNF